MMSNEQLWPQAGATEALTIAGSAGALELKVSAPQERAQPPGVGIVCHPHPKYGGSLDNKVAYMLARSCSQVGLLAVRFNFRGVGRSEGEFGEREGEIEDLAAVREWTRSQWPDAREVLLGFSFGAYIALRAAAREAPLQLVTVAPPLGYFGDEPVPRPDCPWLVVQGSADDVVDPLQVCERSQSLADPPQLEMLDGVGHFFHGHLQALRNVVVPVLERRWASL